VGATQPLFSSTTVSRSRAKEEITKIHAAGRTFDYLLNGTCLDNQELTHSFQKRLSALLGGLDEAGVDGIIVSLPYLAGYVRKNFPRLKVSVSVSAEVDTPNKARFWEDLGADKITLYQAGVNRNLELIKKIRASTKCKLQLVANSVCIDQCPFTVSHGLLCSHSSQNNHFSPDDDPDYYSALCILYRIMDPVYFIRSSWIRPEDTVIYESLGIQDFELTGLGADTRFLRVTAAAYDQRKYNGNLLNLLFPSAKKIFNALTGLAVIDNGRLDGFLLGLQEQGCRHKICSECAWCRKIAEQALRVDPAARENLLSAARKRVEEFSSGRLS
jgi:collagenase-like PrtC family protease